MATPGRVAIRGAGTPVPDGGASQKQAMTTEELGGIIRAARREQDLRQDQLAGAAGVGVRFLSELERGKETARVGKVLAVLDALGCRVRIDPPDGRGADPHGRAEPRAGRTGAAEDHGGSARARGAVGRRER